MPYRLYARPTWLVRSILWAPGFRPHGSTGPPFLSSPRQPWQNPGAGREPAFVHGSSSKHLGALKGVPIDASSGHIRPSGTIGLWDYFEVRGLLGCSGVPAKPAAYNDGLRFWATLGYSDPFFWATWLSSQANDGGF